MRRTIWRLALGAALIASAGAGCSDDDGSSDAVCDQLGAPLREVSGLAFVGDEETVAQLLERIAREARRETFSVIVYLEPGTADDDLERGLAAAEGVVEAEVVLFTPADAMVEFEELLAGQPGVGDVVVESALPASIRFETDDIGDVDRVTAALDAASVPAYQVVDSRAYAQTGGRSLALFAPDLLEQLAGVGNDEVAEAARTLAEVRPSAGTRSADEAVVEAALVLADRAEACGLLD